MVNGCSRPVVDGGVDAEAGDAVWEVGEFAKTREDEPEVLGRLSAGKGGMCIPCRDERCVLKSKLSLSMTGPTVAAKSTSGCS